MAVKAACSELYCSLLTDGTPLEFILFPINYEESSKTHNDVKQLSNY